ncbi:MAG: ABC transporter permease [Planctomycetes bacterium]|nr:ABC transporter permease [Planctomycetota bacterium]
MRTSHHRWTTVGWVILAAVASLCVLSAPWSFGSVRTATVSEPRYAASNLQLSRLPPAWRALEADDAARLEAARAAGDYVPGRILGTDALGRDMLARVLAGGVVSLAVGVFSAAVALVIGTAWGAVAGFAGGRVDSLMMRSVDILFSLPSMLLVVLLAVAVDGFLGRSAGTLPGSAVAAVEFVVLLLAIGGTGWQTMSRVVRGQVLSIRGQGYMEAARAVGMSPVRQFRVHVLPNLAGTVAAYATLAVPAAILSESFLSFLGIGVREPLPSWGNLASSGLPEVNLVNSRWWLLAAPCAMIAVTLVALNFVADSLVAGLDPAIGRSRRA